MPQSLEDALKYSARWIDILHKPSLSEQEAKLRAAGALVVVLFCLYYSAQIFFFGAEFTQVFARTRGSRWHEQQKLDAPAEQS